MMHVLIVSFGFVIYCLTGQADQAKQSCSIHHPHRILPSQAALIQSLKGQGITVIKLHRHSVAMVASVPMQLFQLAAATLKQAHAPMAEGSGSCDRGICSVFVAVENYKQAQKALQRLQDQHKGQKIWIYGLKVSQATKSNAKAQNKMPHSAKRNSNSPASFALCQNSQSSTDDVIVNAIKHGELSALKKYLEGRSGVDLRLRPNMGLLPEDSFQQELHGMKPSEFPTLLMFASYFNQYTVAKWLIEHRADVNAKGIYLVEEVEDFDSSRVWPAADLTPLHLAAAEGDVSLVKLLLRHGAQVNARDGNGWTPLMWVVLNKRAEVMQLLLHARADINSQAEDGSTVLMFAIQRYNTQQVNLLLHAKPNVNLKDKKEKSALKWAADFGEADIYHRLKEAGATGEYSISSGEIRP